MIETVDNIKTDIKQVLEDYKKLNNHFHKFDLRNKDHSILNKLSLWYKINKMTLKEKEKIINMIRKETKCHNM